MNHNNFLTSFIVPAYNAEDTILRCIDSILNQTYTDFEIIIIDDGSTDKTSELLCQYRNLDKKIKHIIKENSGVSSSRNLGISLAQGAHCIFVDSDDTVEPNMLEMFIQSDLSLKSDLIIAGHKKVYDDKITYHLPLYGVFSKNEFLSSLLLFLENENIQGPCSKFYNLDIIRRNNIHFDESLSFGEDSLFVVDYISNCSTISTIETSLYNYNIGSNFSLSRSFRSDKMIIFQKIIDKYQQLLQSNQVSYRELVANRTDLALCVFLDELIRSKKYGEFKKHIDLYIYKKEDKLFRYSYMFRKKTKLIKFFVKNRLYSILYIMLLIRLKIRGE